jgi:hypothetical protein
MAVVDEIVRVLRPGGRLVASEPDYASCAINGADWGTTDVAWANFTRRNRHPRVGRQLAALFARTGLGDIRVTAEAALFREFAHADYYLKLSSAAQAAARDRVLSRTEAARCLEDLRSASDGGELLVAVTMFTATGVRQG